MRGKCLASWQCELQCQLQRRNGGQEIKNFNFQSIILNVFSVTVEDILTVHMWLHGYSSTIHSMHGYGCGRTCA